jgi:MFS transporter, DHA2 family, methylenomycin A resistance protein
MQRQRNPQSQIAPARLSFGFVVVTTSLSFFMAQLDVTIVTVALPRMGRDLHAGLEALQWIVDAYTLSLAVAMLSAGALGDRLGVKRGLQWGMVIFAAASLACASASSATSLILARVLQGVGAAAMLPNSLALLNQAFADNSARRAKAVGWWTASGAISLAAGPILGGVLLAGLGWRSIFLINVPVCVLGLILVARFPAARSATHVKGLDGLGQLCAAAGLALFTAGIIELGHSTITQPLAWEFLGGAVVSGVLLVVVERRASSPILSSDLLSARGFLAAVGFGMVMNFTYYGSIFLLSIFLQEALGYAPLRAGLAFLPLTAGFFVSNVISGPVVARLGSRIPMVIGALIDAVGFSLLLPVSSHSGYAELAVGFLLIPLGMGLAVPAMTSTVLASVPNRLSATASAVLNTARQASGAVGVAILGAWAHGSSEHIAYSIRPAALLCIVVLLGASVLAWRVDTRVARSPAKRGMEAS